MTHNLILVWTGGSWDEPSTQLYNESHFSFCCHKWSDFIKTMMYFTVDEGLTWKPLCCVIQQSHVKFSAVLHAGVTHVFLFLVICSAFVKWLNYIHYSLRNVLPDCKPRGPRRCELCGNKWLMIIKYIFIPYVPLKQNNTPVGRVSKVAITCDLTLGFLLPFKIYFISF